MVVRLSSMAAKAGWVEVSKADRSEREVGLRSQTIAQGLAKRAWIVLGSAHMARVFASWPSA
jgi:hypothetical protein